MFPKGMAPTELSPPHYMTGLPLQTSEKGWIKERKSTPSASLWGRWEHPHFSEGDALAGALTQRKSLPGSVWFSSGFMVLGLCSAGACCLPPTPTPTPGLTGLRMRELQLVTRSLLEAWGTKHPPVQATSSGYCSFSAG